MRDERWNRWYRENIAFFSRYVFPFYIFSIIPKRENAAFTFCEIKKDYFLACNNWHCSVRKAGPDCRGGLRLRVQIQWSTRIRLVYCFTEGRCRLLNKNKNSSTSDMMENNLFLYHF